MNSDRGILKKAFVDTLPVMAGYLVLGFGFGIIAEKSGYGVWLSLAMSLFIYAGSMQYVAISLLSSGASLFVAALTTLMINARHIFYGITMIGPYKKIGKSKPYLIFGLTDETYSLVCTASMSEEDFKKYSLSVTVLDHIYWVFGTLLGGIAGALITFNTMGVDFSMTALFIVVFVEQWRSVKNHIPALVGVLASVACLLIFGADSFLVPAMALITALLLCLRAPVERREASGGACDE